MESQIFGFVDLEWCLGVETPDHLVSWLQMVNVKVQGGQFNSMSNRIGIPT